MVTSHPSTPLRIRAVTAQVPARLGIEWTDGTTAQVDLAGWIATGGDVLAPLRQADVFLKPAIAAYGTAVTWDGDEGDLAIDAVHLHRLCSAQKPFTADDAVSIQRDLALSNSETAALVGVSPSTWATYKTGTAKVPAAIGIALRAMEADPLLLQAHLRPARPRGRPSLHRR